MDVTVTTQQCQELVTSGALAAAKFEKFETVVKVAQMMQAARPVADAYDAARRKLLDDLVVSDDKGNYEKTEDGGLVFKKKDGRQVFDSANLALLSAKTTVNIPTLSILDIQAADSTPLMLFPLVPFCQKTE